MQPITRAGAFRGLPEAGAARARAAIQDAGDRLVASDPGLGRLRQALKAVLAVATTVLVELVYARVLGVPPTLAVLIGAIVAMLVATSVSEPSRTATLRTMAGVPLAASAGAALGVATATQHLLGLVTFVLVSFAAVWVRRFGPRWFTYGFLGWQGFFFALFLHPPLAALPFLVGAIVVASTWVGLLLLTVLRGNPQVRLRRTVDALRARARAGISAMLDVLEEPDADAPRRRLRGQLVQLSEIALLMDGQLGDPRAVPAGLRPGQVRRWAVDIEIAMDEAAAAVLDLARHKDQLPAQLVGDIRRLLRSLGWGVSEQAHQWVATLEQETRSQVAGVRRLVWAATDLLHLVEQWSTAELDDPATNRTDRGDPLDESEDASAFEPVITLFSGNLPGSAAVASSAVEESEGRSWWSPSRLRLTTRQAVQAALAAALAIVAGEAISPQRYYWAVIAAFIAFTGASNTGETFQRSVARVAGTMAGLVGAIASGARDHGPPRRDARGAVRVHLPGVLRPAAVVRRDDLLLHVDARPDVHPAEHLHRRGAGAPPGGDGRRRRDRRGRVRAGPADRDASNGPSGPRGLPAPAGGPARRVRRPPAAGHGHRPAGLECRS